MCVFLFVWFLSVIFNLQLGSIYSFLQKLVYLFVCLSVKGGEDYYIVIIFCLRVLENARCDDFI